MLEVALLENGRLMSMTTSTWLIAKTKTPRRVASNIAAD
jgi:hypothetical protein